MPDSPTLEVIKKAHNWINQTTGQFSAVSFGIEAGFFTVEQRNSLLKDFVDMGCIEPVGNKNGFYQRVDSTVQEMNWKSAEDEPYPLWLPLGINDLCRVSPKNVIVLAGESNAGKSELALQIARNNLIQNGGVHKDIHFFTCEMGPHEVKGRLLNMAPEHAWDGLHCYERYENYHAAIKPGMLNIIDYLEVHNDFYLMGHFLDRIHQSIGGGVAVVCIQKHAGNDLGMGGQFSSHRTRLMVSLSYNRETHLRTAKIIKCKYPLGMVHPDGMQMDFTLDRGKITTVHDWAHVTKEQRQARDDVASRQLRNAELKKKNAMAREEIGI